MKLKKMLFCLALWALALVLPLFGTYGCGLGKKYFSELKAAYSYDQKNSVLVKYPSEIIWESGELLSYAPKTKKTNEIEYEIVELTLPKRDHATGEMADYPIYIAYASQNDSLIFTEIPNLYPPHEYFASNSFADSVVVTIDDENAFLVNLSDKSAKKLYDDRDLESYLEKDTQKKLVYAKTISISPNGRYLLYLSNRDYITVEMSHSVDIYCYDFESGSEKKIGSFENFEFLCWDGDNDDRFLVREESYFADGKKAYSEIFSYSAKDLTLDVFYTPGDQYKNYEMIGNGYIYAIEKTEKETIVHIADIYSGETFSVSAGRYSIIDRLELSESKEYIAFFGTYINVDWMAIAEIVTVNTNTGNLMAHYEQGENEYYIDSIAWLPDNVLAINFINTAELYKDLCRLHNINH
ncbi:MAG: hypothetical protein FWH48_05125 [Oscillospiraceae bacterium]|nr:hypothetical protein [Oscillospiraceae bacterium]MCL2158773.1 hypothetical protein [Oscillospiraceae bacterium]